MEEIRRCEKCRAIFGLKIAIEAIKSGKVSIEDFPEKLRPGVKLLIREEK